MHPFLITGLLLLASLVPSGAGAAAVESVMVQDPYIDLHSGPGRGYPVFFVTCATAVALPGFLFLSTDLATGTSVGAGYFNYLTLFTLALIGGILGELAGDGGEDVVGRGGDVFRFGAGPCPALRRPEPVVVEGISRSRPADMACHLAIWLKISSPARPMKSQYMSSTSGRHTAAVSR